MFKKFKFIAVLILILVSNTVSSQKEKIIGFWEIEKVSVGTENMTPVAKWTKIKHDGTYQSGNGWLQNSYGTWKYDAQNNTYAAIDSLDIFDEFGGFKVSFDQQKMFWERQEEGMKVKVTLKPIEELPMSTADYLEGMWKLDDISQNGVSIRAEFDADQKHKLFMRWDRIYLNFTPEGNKQTGYWHINGHKPEITMLPHQEGEKAQSWRIEVDEKELIMTGISDGNNTIKRRYIRKNSF